MKQLTFFDTGLVPVTPADLGAMLVAQGQCQLLFGNSDTTRGRRRKPVPQSARLSVLLHSEWRARQLCELASMVDVTVSQETPDDNSWLVRMEGPALLPVAQEWTKGAVKTVPAQWRLSDRALQVWALVVGVLDESGMCFGLDAHIAQHEELRKRAAEALQKLGAASSYVGPRAGGPALRVVGQRRLANVMTIVGEPPEDGSWDA